MPGDTPLVHIGYTYIQSRRTYFALIVLGPVGWLCENIA